MNTMTEEQKENARNKVNTAAVTAARKTAEKAKTASGWKKWVLIAATALLALLAGLTQVGCENITPEQIQGAHNIYHAVSGKPCVFVIQSSK